MSASMILEDLRNFSVCVCLFMCSCVSACGLQRPAKLPAWLTEGFDILLSIMCTNNMVTCPQSVIITPK